MRTTVKFQMDEPTNAKWDCYVKLLPEIDDIIRNLDVDLLTRKHKKAITPLRKYLIIAIKHNF